MKRLAFPLLMLLVILGCGKREEPKKAEVATPAKVEPAASVVFAKGTVQHFAQGIWQAVAINDRLLLTDSLEMAVGSALELSPDSAQTIKLAGPQKGVVGELMEVALRAPAASTITKTVSVVKKIQGSKQTLTTQTPTAVAGIRGTAGRAPLPPDSAQGDSSSQ